MDRRSRYRLPHDLVSEVGKKEGGRGETRPYLGGGRNDTEGYTKWRVIGQGNKETNHVHPMLVMHRENKNGIYIFDKPNKILLIQLSLLFFVANKVGNITITFGWRICNG